MRERWNFSNTEEKLGKGYDDHFSFWRFETACQISVKVTKERITNFKLFSQFFSGNMLIIVRIFIKLIFDSKRKICWIIVLIEFESELFSMLYNCSNYVNNS